MSSPAERMRRVRDRQANGRVSLRVELDEAQLLETLATARLIDRNAEYSRPELEHALERLIDAVGRMTL